MRNLAQPEGRVRVGRHIAPHHGIVSPCVGSTFLDGPTGAKVKCPRSIAEWAHVAEGLQVPNAYWPCNEASGSLVDEATGISLAATGAVAYRVTLTDWAGFWVGFTSSSGQGFRTGLETFYDPQSPVFGTFDFHCSSTGGDRTLWSLGPTLILQLKSTGFLQLNINGTTFLVGTFDYRHATNVYPLTYWWEPGTASPFLEISTNKEKLTLAATGALSIQGDGVKGFGGASTSPPVFQATRPAVWVGGAARDTGLSIGTRGLNAARGWAMSF